ncbi:zonular occludens toxin domain-containing protein [Campylobacter curvus]|uniref:zonular occludens toxin domain-containing protein n=1 Tax=Campylobacter curvus TaxID=200 RepID=UPI00147010BF|nr:zonular occludens toxin domain-containing protein [Campylobacter curvus]
MITYLVGNMGSGKTYYAVFKIYQLFLFKPEDSFLSKVIKPDDKRPEYLYCYTNIDGFKFDFDERFIKFNFESFYSDLEILYNLHIDGVSDKEVNEKAKELKLSRVFVVLDEAHNFFKKTKDPVLVWWLTYHRHLYQEIILITQNLALINSEYKRIANYFYRAVDSSRRFFSKKFRYILYSSHQLFKKDILNTINVPFSDEIFNLYHSGDAVSSKSYVRFYLLLFLVIIAVLCVAFYFLVNSFSSDSEKPLSAISNFSSVASYSNSLSFASPHQKQPKSDSISQSTYIYNLICINEICHFINQKYTFPFSYVSFVISSSKPLYFYPVTKNSHFTEYFLVFDTPALDDLVQTSNKFNKKDVSNESFKTTDTSPTLFK